MIVLNIIQRLPREEEKPKIIGEKVVLFKKDSSKNLHDTYVEAGFPAAGKPDPNYNDWIVTGVGITHFNGSNKDFMNGVIPPEWPKDATLMVATISYCTKKEYEELKKERIGEEE